jgi:hypothetical protein
MYQDPTLSDFVVYDLYEDNGGYFGENDDQLENLSHKYSNDGYDDYLERFSNVIGLKNSSILENSSEIFLNNKKTMNWLRYLAKTNIKRNLKKIYKIFGQNIKIIITIAQAVRLWRTLRSFTN